MLKHRVRDEGGTAVVSFEGDVDLESSPQARRVLLESVERGSLLVDLSGVEYMDSSGVASLVEAFQIARRRGTSFGLVGLLDAPRRVLQLARLDRVFPIFGSVEEGLRGGT